MHEFLNVARVPAIIGTIGGISCIVAAQGGEPFYPLAYMMHHGGAIVMLCWLVAVCRKLDLGFRQTLLRLIVFLCVPYCGIPQVAFLIEWLKPNPFFQGDIKELLLLTGALFGTSLVASIVVAYFYGLFRLWTKSRREKVVAGTIRSNFEARQKVTGQW